jgi:hypothetical protein
MDDKVRTNIANGKNQAIQNLIQQENLITPGIFLRIISAGQQTVLRMKELWNYGFMSGTL